MDELAFILDGFAWPKFPVLPVVNRHDRRAGFLWFGTKPTVFIGNIYNLPPGNFETVTHGLEQMQYTSFEAILVDWRVD